jgi:hypothetical protein
MGGVSFWGEEAELYAVVCQNSAEPETATNSGILRPPSSSL